ncbi:MAG: division/cell wall cluster transcriptional repressor MraZ [Lachnospiraceae bacterium]|nr:division/cell wall cluster transcriptional repressor MraZ [Lachnospiraceae bacterium]
MFVGEYAHTLDTKGRLIIPASFREDLGDTFFVTKGNDNCLYIYSQEDWEALVAKLRSLPQLSSEAVRKLNRTLMGGANKCESDRQGRILISPPLRAYAGLKKDVVLVGVGDHVEIWNRESWQQEMEDVDMNAVSSSLESLGI